MSDLALLVVSPVNCPLSIIKYLSRVEDFSLDLSHVSFNPELVFLKDLIALEMLES